MPRRRFHLLFAAALGAAALSGAAHALWQGDASAALRATGKVGEQADGYLGLVDGDTSLRAQIDAINIKRRAYYTDLAAKRGAKIEEVAATTGCELLRTKVASGQFYRGADGVWRQRAAGPVPLPSYCG